MVVDGLQLRERRCRILAGPADGTTVLWTELGQKLRPLNIATGFNLLVVLACCDGIHQIQAFTIHEVVPFLRGGGLRRHNLHA